MTEKLFPKVGDFVIYGNSQIAEEVVYVYPDNEWFVIQSHVDNFGAIVRRSDWDLLNWRIVEPLVERWAVIRNGEVLSTYSTREAANNRLNKEQKIIHFREVRDDG